MTNSDTRQVISNLLCVYAKLTKTLLSVFSAGFEQCYVYSSYFSFYILLNALSKDVYGFVMRICLLDIEDFFENLSLLRKFKNSVVSFNWPMGIRKIQVVPSIAFRCKYIYDRPRRQFRNDSLDL